MPVRMKGITILTISLLMLQGILVIPVLSTEQKKSFDELNKYNSSWEVDTPSASPSIVQTSDISLSLLPSSLPSDDPMDSSWPMLSHDNNHTGRSQYSTLNVTGSELWRIMNQGAMESSAIVDKNGTVYFGCWGPDSYLYAVYPNGTIKWKYKAHGTIWCTPAIAADGTIYFGTYASDFTAISSNGEEKWLYMAGLASYSPAIAKDGTIIFGSENGYVYAVNPDGSSKWRFHTGYDIKGSPAIGIDGTIYIGSGDDYLYALSPNGSLIWQFNTGGYIKGSASIAPDGTIYVPSFNGFLYAITPDGKFRWAEYTGGSIAGAGVALASDGTIYIGTDQLRAFYPNGTLKWITAVGGDIYGTVPAVSMDGTIFVTAGKSLVAVNPDGSIIWQKQISTEQSYSSPSIGPNDIVLVGSETDTEKGRLGFLHVFGPGQPKNITIVNPVQGHRYLFYKDQGKSLLGITEIIGGVTIKVTASVEQDIDHIDFFVAQYSVGTPNFRLQYTTTFPPFQWNMNKHYRNDIHPLRPFGFKIVRIIGYYKSGCSWIEDLPKVWYLHML